MSVNQHINPEIEVGTTVIVVDGGSPKGTFFELDKALLGRTGVVEHTDRGYTIYQPEAYVRFDDGTIVCIELPNLAKVTIVPQVAEKPVTPAQATRQPRIKYLYSVEDNGVSVYTTFDREDAREEKAFLGGKAEGVIITAYAPVKEIR